MISCPTFTGGISDYLTAMLDGNQEAPPRDTNAGSAHRITSLSLFFSLFSTFSISNSRPLVSTPCFHLFFFCLCFMSFRVSALQLSLSLISPLNVLPYPPFHFHLLLHPFLENMCNCTAAVGVCFHIDAKEKCRFWRCVCVCVCVCVFKPLYSMQC